MSTKPPEFVETPHGTVFAWLDLAATRHAKFRASLSLVVVCGCLIPAGTGAAYLSLRALIQGFQAGISGGAESSATMWMIVTGLLVVASLTGLVAAILSYRAHYSLLVMRDGVLEMDSLTGYATSRRQPRRSSVAGWQPSPLTRTVAYVDIKAMGASESGLWFEDDEGNTTVLPMACFSKDEIEGALDRIAKHWRSVRSGVAEGDQSWRRDRELVATVMTHTEAG